MSGEGPDPGERRDIPEPRGPIEAADAEKFAASQLILESLPVGIWTTDEHGRVLYQNPAARKILELDPGATFTTLAPKGWEWNSLKPVQPDEWVWRRVFLAGEPLLDHLVSLEEDDGTLK